MLKCFHCGGLTAKGQVVEGEYRVEVEACLACVRDQLAPARAPTPQEMREYKGDTHYPPSELELRKPSLD